jgi:hypothetical protein
LFRLVLPEIGGGRMREADLATIADHPEASALQVSGLDQQTFERLVADYGGQFTGIEFWKCPRIADFSPLEDLPDLQLVAVYWNQRTTRLWDLSRNSKLRGLRFDDFTRLHDLRDVSGGGALKELEFGDLIWSTSVFDTLEPLAALTGLESLRFDAKRITDGRVQPLGELRSLRSLRFPPNQFTTRQVAWLRARLPGSLQSPSLEPVLTMRQPLQLHGKPRDVRLVGKQKPFLHSVLDAPRVEKHVTEFWRMVDEFSRDPAAQPD